MKAIEELKQYIEDSKETGVDPVYTICTCTEYWLKEKINKALKEREQEAIEHCNMSLDEAKKVAQSKYRDVGEGRNSWGVSHHEVKQNIFNEGAKYVIDNYNKNFEEWQSKQEYL